MLMMNGDGGTLSDSATFSGIGETNGIPIEAVDFGQQVTAFCVTARLDLE